MFSFIFFILAIVASYQAGMIQENSPPRLKSLSSRHAPVLSKRIAPYPEFTDDSCFSQLPYLRKDVKAASTCTSLGDCYVFALNAYIQAYRFYECEVNRSLRGDYGFGYGQPGSDFVDGNGFGDLSAATPSSLGYSQLPQSLVRQSRGFPPVNRTPRGMSLKDDSHIKPGKKEI